VDLAAVNHSRKKPLSGPGAVPFGAAKELAYLSKSGGKKA